MSTMPEEGKLFDNRYQIIRKIAEGGMGIVYQAVEIKTGQMVAIKLILPHSMNENAIERFRKEAEAIKRLNHPNIVKFHHFTLRNKFTYIVLEYLTGQTLQEKLAAGYRFSVDEAVYIVCQLGKALEYAHQRGIVHRDLKPSNVMLNEHGQPVLMDFGVVQMEGTPPLTATGARIGSVAYMSLEQAKGDKVDHRTDIYSLGVLLYQLLTGRMPFWADNEAAALIKIMMEAAPDMRQFKPDLPPVLVKVVAKAMHKEREQRYESAAAFTQALTHFRTPETVPSPKTTVLPTAPSWVQQFANWLPLSLLPFAGLLFVVGAMIILFVIIGDTIPLTPTTTDQPILNNAPASQPTGEEGSAAIVTPTEHQSENEKREDTPLTISVSVTIRSDGATDPVPPTPTLALTPTNTPTPLLSPRVTTATATTAAFGGEPDTPIPTITLHPRTTVLFTPPPIFETPLPPVPEPGETKKATEPPPSGG